MRVARFEPMLIAMGTGLFAWMLLGNLGHPLVWADEAETAMFGRRVLEYGYPKVHGREGVVYQFGANVAVGVKEGPDAYIGTTWAQFYAAAPGLLWARASDDPWQKTFRLRLPFALAGAAGVGVWLGALLPAVAPGRRRRFAAAFLLASALSVSLLLHLRELRYYALVVLEVGLLARLHLGYTLGGGGRRVWAWGVALLLPLLFFSFVQAFFAVGALLGFERIWAAARGRADLRDLLPFAAAGALSLPGLLWFETFQTAAAYAEGFDFGPARYLENLGRIGAHLLRHEFLAPALVCRVAALWSGAGRGGSGAWAGRLLLFAAGYALIGAANPLPLERYFVVLSPVLSGAFLLDGFALVARVAERRGRAPARLATAGLVLLALLLRAPGLPALAGRVAELRTPYAGPLDFAIPRLLEDPHPERLVVATNYEEYAFMYYLGARTIVGLSLNNLLRDREEQPDVVVPRRRWPRSLAELRPFLARGDWEKESFPVRDLHHNNVPALSRSPWIPDPHRFTTAHSDDPDQQLVIYWRASAKRTGTSSRP